MLLSRFKLFCKTSYKTKFQLQNKVPRIFMSTYTWLPRSFLLTIALTFLLVACGGGSSSFDEDSLDPITIEPIETTDGGEEGGEEGGTEGEVTVGGSLSEEELAALPQIDIPQRKFSDPGSIVTLSASVSAQEGATVVATLWEQTSGPSIEIANPERLNTSIFVPTVNEETLLTFRLVAQDDDGRVNAATTTVVIQNITNPLRVIGGIADEGDESFSVTIELNEASSTDTVVEYLTFDGTATSALDYTEALGTVTIPAGETQVSVDVPLMTGDLYFDAESFFFQALTLREDGTRSRSLATILIRNANPAAVIDVPELQDIPAQIFAANTAVDGVLFDNTNDSGDRILECVSNITLPPGLRLEITELGASCAITGTPLTSVAETEYIITAINPTGESTATITIEVLADDTDIEPPELVADRNIEVLIINEAIEPPIVFFNNGGQQNIECSSDELPNGLTVEVAVEEPIEEGVTETFINCQIVGTPTELSEEATYTVTASNSGGESSANILLSVIEVLEPVTEVPMLVEGSTFLPNGIISFDPFVFENTGGGSIKLCEDVTGGVQTLDAAGLTVRPTDDRRSCQIEAVDALNAIESSYDIRVVNAVGESTTRFSVDPRFSAPLFNNSVMNQTVLVDDVANIRFDSDVTFFTACTIEPELPTGLTVELSDDRNYENACVITGIPTEVSDFVEYTVTGNSEYTTIDEGVISQTATATITLSVEEATAPDLSDELLEFNVTVGQTISDVSLVNTGGDIVECDWADEAPVPPGLTVGISESECVISGTPTSAGTFSSSITATNEFGEDSVNVQFIVVEDVTPPILDNPAATLTFTVGEEGVEFSINNTGGLIDQCRAVDDLPVGLDVATGVNEDFGICYVFGTPTEASEATDYAIEVTFGDGETVETLDAVINITVIENIEPPQAPIITSNVNTASYTDGVPINQIVFANTGGNVSSCVTSEPLPTGLVFTLFEQDSGIFTCALSGTPASVLESTPYTFGFESSAEPVEVLFTIEVEAALLAPVLNDLPAQSFEPSEAVINDIVFSNSGGGELISCTSVPDINTTTPFTLAPSADDSTCVISGTPITEFEEQEFTVTANNATGSDSGTITLSVEQPLLAPDLFGFDEDQFYLLDQDIPLTVFDNDGGSELISCDDNSTLPLGLTTQVSATASSCEIVGTPEQITPLTSYQITAENEAGSDTAAIRIAVYDSPELNPSVTGPISVNVNDALTDTEVLLSAGGIGSGARIIACTTSPALPVGLSFEINDDEDNCVLSGTASTATELQTYILTAANVVAESSFNISIEVLEEVFTPETLSLDYTLASTDELPIRIEFTAGTVELNLNDGTDPVIFDAPSVDLVLDAAIGEGDIETMELTFSNGLEVLTELEVENDFVFDLSVLEAATNLTTFTAQSTEITGNLVSLSDLEALQVLSIDGNFGSLVGDLSELPKSLNTIVFSSSIVDLSGDIQELGDNIEIFSILSGFGSISIEGNLSSLSDKVNLSTFEIQTFTDADDVINIEGDLASLVNLNQLSTFRLDDTQNIIFGDILNLPASIVRFDVFGQNTLSGDIQDIPDSTSIFRVGGENTLSGDIANLPDMSSLLVRGQNTITGDIGTLPIGVPRIDIFGENTLSGLIQDLHEDMVSIDVGGNNVISGDIGLFQSIDIDRIIISGFNSIDTFNVNPTWNPTRGLILQLTGDGDGFDSDSLDRLFDHLSVTLTNNFSGELTFQRIFGDEATEASDLSRQTLENLGYNIEFNTFNISDDAVITSSGDFSANFPGSNAFDETNGTLWLSDEDSLTAWIAIAYPTPICVDAYSIRFANGSDLVSRSPKDFELQARDSDAEDWLTIDQRVNEIDWLGSETRTYTVLNDDAYEQYRLFVNDDNDDREGVVVASIDELNLQSCDTTFPIES